MGTIQLLRISALTKRFFKISTQELIYAEGWIYEINSVDHLHSKWGLKYIDCIPNMF